VTQSVPRARGPADRAAARAAPDRPRTLCRARDATVQRIAQEAGLPPEQVLERIQTRLADPSENHPLLESQHRAVAVQQRLRALPRFVVPGTGQPLARTPEQEDALERELQFWRAQASTRVPAGQRVPRERWPAEMRVLDDAYRWGQVLRVTTLIQDPDAAHYDRWYGTGRALTAPRWTAYQAGAAPKYRGVDAQTALYLDGLVRLHEALPRQSRERQALDPIVHQIRRLAVPGWRQVLDQLAEE
jgi:hypothetical protein